MYKVLILKDTETGKFFTGSYNGYWSREISEAKEFDDDIQIELKVADEQTNESEAFENIQYLEVITILKKLK
jgi:hypothetical protein